MEFILATHLKLGVYDRFYMFSFMGSCLVFHWLVDFLIEADEFRIS